MGRTLGFDHFNVGKDLDAASWDSYPIGFLGDRIEADADHKLRHLHSGDPDFQAFHHDLYRAVGKDRWWVMEQQPGPVNWARNNPVPRDGMVRLWSLEAAAHGAEVVSYFRWRQAPFAQEQMHAGLLRPDHVEAPGFFEARKSAADLKAIGDIRQRQAPVRIVFDYPSAWAWEIQPQSAEFDYFRLVFDFYRALRGLGIDADFCSADAPDLAGAKLVIVPGLFAFGEAMIAALRATDACVLIGPRSGSKTVNFAIPDDLPPNLPADLLDLRIARIDSLPPGAGLASDSGQGSAMVWREFCEPGGRCKVAGKLQDGTPWLLAQDKMRYLAVWPDAVLAGKLLRDLAAECGIAARPMPQGVRMRETAKHCFVFNYGDVSVDLADLKLPGQLIVGEAVLAPSGIAVLARN
jgi:beta-galactosidase